MHFLCSPVSTLLYTYRSLTSSRAFVIAFSAASSCCSLAISNERVKDLTAASYSPSLTKSKTIFVQPAFRRFESVYGNVIQTFRLCNENTCIQLPHIIFRILSLLERFFSEFFSFFAVLHLKMASSDFVKQPGAFQSRFAERNLLYPTVKNI